MSTTPAIPAVPIDHPVQPAQAKPPIQAAAPVQAAPVVDTGTGDAPAPQVEIQADLRLVIEEDKAARTYVYKTVDPRTGKVISQIPREQLLQMREAWSYKPGSVIDSRS